MIKIPHIAYVQKVINYKIYDNIIISETTKYVNCIL